MRGRRTTCVLQKNFPTATGSGYTPGWHPVQSFHGVLSPVSQREQLLADADTEFNEYILRFAAEAIAPANHAEINAKNRISIGAKDYEIIAAEKFAGRGKHRKLRLLNVTGRADD